MVFASLAITFLLEIDDQLMETLCDRITHSYAHYAVEAGYRRALAARIVARGPGGAAAPDRIVKMWAFALVVALSVLHLCQTLQVQTRGAVAIMWR